MRNVSPKLQTTRLPCLTFSPTARLKGSRFDSKQDLEVLRENFDAGLKTNFSENTKSHHLKFGSPREHDPGCGVKNGKLALQG